MGRAKDQELLEASRNGDIKTVGKLLELTTKRHGPLSSFRRSPSINCQDMNGYTSLHHACLNGHSNIVRLLLAHDVQLDLPDVRGSTSLYLASWAGHQDIVKMLLMNGSKGANPNAQTIENETPLHSAAQHGHNTVVAILLAYGADPCIRNNSFQTALDLASQFGRLQVVQLLLRAHPDLIAQYRSCGDTFLQQGYSPPYATTPTKLIFTHTCLHLASRNGHKKVVETLLAAGVDVNILTHAGTALHEAALCGKKSVVTTLLKAGVDVYATDGNGRTALDILKDYPPHVTYDIVTVITEYMNIGKLLFQPIQSQNGSVGAVIENTHSLPRRLYEKNVQKPKNAKLEFVPKPRNNHQQLTQQQQHQNGLSNSLSSLDRYATAPETYLKMKPIKWQKSATDIEVSARNGEQIQTYRPVYKQPYSGAFMQAKKLTEFDGGTIPSRSIEYINLIKSDSVSDEQNSTQSSDQQPHMRYRCVDDYVEMTEPESSVTPQPSPRLLDTADYANLPKTESETNEDKRKDSITDIDTNNNSKQLIFRSKTHSPTPDYPPPTVRQAEHTIFEYIQPLSLQVNNRHSGEIRDTESMEHNELSPRPTSEASDCVEHYVGDVPFAGLFKGSTLHLELDETDGNGAPNRDGLRSPSLVRSIPAARRSLSKQRYSTAGEDFSASRVWAEIDTIFETIGNEVLTAEHNNNPNEGVDIEIAHDVKEEDIGKQHTTDIATPNKDEDAVYEHKSTTQPELKVVITNNELRQSLHIRNPDELLLDSPCSPSGAGVNWCHSSYALIYGEIRYTVFYLGSTVIRCLQGTTSTRKSIQKLKIYEKNDENLLEKCNTSTKYLKSANLTTRSKLGIAVSHAGVKFLDQEKDNTFCMHDIENINCVCQDTDDLRYFAYITKEQELHYCHVFMVDNLDLAKEIILTLGQAFEVAYQLALSRQCTPIEEEKRCLEKEEVENI